MNATAAPVYEQLRILEIFLGGERSIDFFVSNIYIFNVFQILMEKTIRSLNSEPGGGSRPLVNLRHCVWKAVFVFMLSASAVE